LDLQGKALINFESLNNLNKRNKYENGEGRWEPVLSLVNRDLTQANLSNTDIRQVELSGAKLNRATLDRAWADDAHFNEAEFQGASLVGTRLQHTWLNGAQLQGASLGFARLHGVSLAGAWLQSADLERAELEAAIFADVCVWRADAREAVWKDAWVSLGKSPQCDWTAEHFENLKKLITETVPEGENRRQALNQIEERLDPSKPLDGAAWMAKVWRDKKASSPAPEKREKRIAEIWAKIGCSADGAPYVARALLKRISGSFEDDSPEPAKLAAAFLDDKNCPGARGLAAEEKAALKEIRESAPAPVHKPRKKPHLSAKRELLKKDSNSSVARRFPSSPRKQASR
jgi:hypothetical protein